MKFVADECCDAPLVEGLRADGHDVIFIMEIAPGAEDDVVLGMAASQNRIIITEDKDFGELVVRLRLPAYGILFIRLKATDSEAKLIRLREVIHSHGHRLEGSFVVVDKGKVRIRPIQSV